MVVGIPLEDSTAAYFEFSDLADANSTLHNVGLSLLFGGMITTLAGALTGMIAAKRAIRPLGDAAQAAKAIAGGRLDTRLESTDDHDLQLLSTAFNDMAEALQNRVERDARFASDVSHELRSPLMTLAASVEVMKARRDDLPERAQAALDLLVGDVARFQGLVEDLLEISRFDAGAIRLHLEDLLVAEFVRQAVAVSSLPQSKLTVSDRAEGLIMHGDRRRLARVVANLIDNARVHGGGAPEISVTEAEGEGEPLAHVWIVVEDHGPGVPIEERSLVFERFARGAVAGRRSSSDGAGLGLSLVDEHVRMHGGRVWVEDRARRRAWRAIRAGAARRGGRSRMTSGDAAARRAGITRGTGGRPHVVCDQCGRNTRATSRRATAATSTPELRAVRRRCHRIRPDLSPFTRGQRSTAHASVRGARRRQHARRRAAGAVQRPQHRKSCRH